MSGEKNPKEDLTISPLDALAKDIDPAETTANDFEGAVTFGGPMQPEETLREIAESKEEGKVAAMQDTEASDAATIDLELPKDVQSDLESELAKASGGTKNDSIYALSTENFELEKFFNITAGNAENYQNKPLFQDFLRNHAISLFNNPEPPYTLKWNSTKPIIEKMPFEMSWDFRNYQIKNMQPPATEFARRVGIKLEDGVPVQGSLSNDTFKEKRAYFERMTKLYAGISIDEVKDKDGNKLENTRAIKKGDQTLVTITTDHSPQPYGNQLNNMVYKINPNLKGEDLENAIKIMIDQTTRHQEKSRSSKLEISGYLNNPETALKIYLQAVLQGASPAIHPKTFKEWQDKADDKSNPRQAEFQRAVDFIKDYKDIAKNNKISKLPKLLKGNPELKTMDLTKYLSGEPSVPESDQNRRLGSR